MNIFKYNVLYIYVLSSALDYPQADFIYSNGWICFVVVQGPLSTIGTIVRCNHWSTFFLASSSREVGDSTICLKLLDNIAHGGHRNITVSGDELVALRLSMLGYNLSNNSLLFFARSDTEQQNEYFYPFKLVEWVTLRLQIPVTHQSEFKVNHQLEIQLILATSKKVPIIFGLSILFQLFLFIPLQAKEIHMWIPKCAKAIKAAEMSAKV